MWVPTLKESMTPSLTHFINVGRETPRTLAAVVLVMVSGTLAYGHVPALGDGCQGAQQRLLHAGRQRDLLAVGGHHGERRAVADAGRTRVLNGLGGDGDLICGGGHCASFVSAALCGTEQP